MSEPIKPIDAKPPEGIVNPTPQAGQPVTPAAAPAAQPTPGAGQIPGATPAPGGTGQVPIAALHEERTKRQGLEREVEQLREAVQQRAFESQQQYQQPQQQPQNQQPNQSAQQMEQMWEDNPRQAVQAEIYQAMQWRDAIDSGISQQAANLQNKYSDFNDHRQNAETYVRALPLEQRANPRVMETAYFIVRGQNVDKVLEKQKADLYNQFQNGGAAINQVITPSAGAYSSPPAIPGIVLTQEQITAASAMGMSPEDYASAVQVK